MRGIALSIAGAGAMIALAIAFVGRQSVTTLPSSSGWVVIAVNGWTGTMQHCYIYSVEFTKKSNCMEVAPK